MEIQNRRRLCFRRGFRFAVGYLPFPLLFAFQLLHQGSILLDVRLLCGKMKQYRSRFVQCTQSKHISFVTSVNISSNMLISFLSLLYVQYAGFLLCATCSPVCWSRFARYIQSKHIVFVVCVTFSPNILFSFYALHSVQTHCFRFVRYIQSKHIVFVLCVTFSTNALLSFCPLRSVLVHYFCFVRYTQQKHTVFVLSVLIGSTRQCCYVRPVQYEHVAYVRCYSVHTLVSFCL